MDEHADPAELDQDAGPPELERDAAARARREGPEPEPLDAEERPEGAELLDYEPVEEPVEEPVDRAAPDDR